MEKNRESGVELLRIISLLGVIFIHYSDILLPLLESSKPEFLLVHILRTMSAASVDVFLIISGYFMCNSYQRKLGKPLDLIIQVSFYGILIYLIEVLLKYAPFSLPILVGNLIPDSYYTTFFVIVYLLSPYINVLFHTIDKKDINRLMLCLLIIFSFYSTLTTFWDEISSTKWMGLNPVGAWGSQQGFNIVNFILCYCVGACIRLSKIPTWLSSITIKSALILGIVIVLSSFAIFENSLNVIGMRTAWVYDNPLVILMGVLLFLCFKDIKFHNNAVNKCAKLVYPTFLIHCFVINKVHIETFCTISIFNLFMHFIVFSLLMFMVSGIFYQVYFYVVGRLVTKLDKYTITIVNIM